MQDLAGRLGDRPGGRSGGASGGLAGAAAGLAGGGLAGKFLGGGSEGSEEDFRREVADQIALMDERLQILEDQMQELRGMLGSTEAPTEPEGEADPGSLP